MSIIPGVKAPWFASKVYLNDDFYDLSTDDLKGHWFVLFFYPYDFGPIAPSELQELEKAREKIKALDCKLVAISRDSVVVHEQFVWQHKACKGASGIKFPLMEDLTGEIGEKFGMVKEDKGYSFRGYFIINPEGVVRSRVTSDLPVGISVTELLRQLEELTQSESSILEDSLTGQYDSSLLNTDNIIESITKTGSTISASVLSTPPVREGKKQSPINIDTKTADSAPSMGQITFVYSPPSLLYKHLGYKVHITVISNNGRGWEIPVSDGYQGRVYTKGPQGPLRGEYILSAIEAHWGSSEHSMDGKHYDGELHFVHYNRKYDRNSADVHIDGRCIVAVFLEASSEVHNPELEKVAPMLQHIEEEGSVVQIPELLNFTNLLPPGNGEYYTYQGSTTHPDYLENVTWIVMANPVPINPETLKAMKRLRFGKKLSPRQTRNTRPKQELGDRVVRYYPAKTST